MYVTIVVILDIIVTALLFTGLFYSARWFVRRVNDLRRAPRGDHQ